MVGKFLLGMVSGGLLVAAGLVIGSAVAPMRPAKDNAPTDAQAPAAEDPIVAPEATTADAGAAVETEAATGEAGAQGPVAEGQETTAEAVEAEAPAAGPATDDAAAPQPAATSAAEAPDEPVAAALPDTPPEVAAADDGPTAPEAEVAALAEPAAPAPTEVTKPETAAAPAKPAEATADAAAVPPEPVAPAPAPAEETVLAEAGAAAAGDSEGAPDATTGGDGTETALAPEAPETAPAEAATTPEPAPAATPEPTAEEAPEAAPEAPAEPAAEPEPAPEPAVPVEEAPAGDTQVAEAGTETEAGTGAEAAPPVAETVPDTMTPEPEVAGTDMPGVQPEAMPGTPEAPPVETAEAEAPGSKSTFDSAPGLVREGEGLIIGRGTKDPAPDAAPDPAAVPEDPRPIARFAATFENPEAKPPLAIVLIDRGQPDLDRAGLATLPFPVSFALDPLDPATPERAAIYRAAGREVVMLVTGIAEGARASDVEVAFQSMEQGLPEAVAVMDLAEPTFQNNRGLASAVVPILKAQGRGLLTWDAGLNAADQVARREDLEAGVVFRDLGAAGTDRVALRRLMDRAVFKAGQDGRVSVVGEANAETVAALLEWTVEGKAATVVLAPVTAVLAVE